MRILFVDDDPNILQGLKRGLRTLRHEHDLHYANDAYEALTILVNAERPFHIIVSDLRMPGMDGAVLLDNVRSRFPHMFRFALSGGAEPETQNETAQLAHQYLAKPCDMETLRAAISGVRTLNNLLPGGPLRTLLSHITAIPTSPHAYNMLMQELRKEEPSIRAVGKIIADDPAMTVKVLQLVNSAFFGVAHTVTRPEQAATLLGLETIKSLVLSIGIFSEFEPEFFPEFSYDAILEHGMTVGMSARKICRAIGADIKAQDASFTAGALHDVGKLVLASYLPIRYRDVLQSAREDKVPLHVAEFRSLKATHAEAGAYLMGMWGIPDMIIEAIAYHHRPAEAPTYGAPVLTAVHAANGLVNELSTRQTFQDETLLNTTYLEDHGLKDQLDSWREIVSGIVTKE